MAVDIPTKRPEEIDYLSRLQSTQQETYPGFVEQLKNQTGFKAEEGRAAVIEFEDGAEPVTKRLLNPQKLREYLTKAPSTDTIVRRVFILEGLPKAFIKVLGWKLGVPPPFFAAHWVNPEDFRGTLLNRTPRHYHSQSRFILTLPKLHRARIKELKNDMRNPIYYMESSVHRRLSRITLFGDFEGPLSSFEQLSFWSRSNGDSWDAVLLVDPPLGGYVRWEGKGEHPLREVDYNKSINLVDIDGVCQNGSWYPPYDPNPTPSSDSASRNRAKQAPEMQSLFDDIFDLYPLSSRQSTDLKTCTDICRRLVVLAWTASLRVVEAQTIREQHQMSTNAMSTDISAATWLDNSWTRPWQPRQFGRLMRAKMALELIDAELYSNMDALGIGGNSSTIEGWEAEGWRSLQNAVRTMKVRVDMIAQAYTQAVSVRESITSNTQARQVGYLTSMATLFIPASFIAAIFSMNGEFSAGADRFWVYWVTAVPIVVVSCILLFTRFGGWALRHATADDSLV